MTIFDYRLFSQCPNSLETKCNSLVATPPSGVELFSLRISSENDQHPESEVSDNKVLYYHLPFCDI
jgi:hypothetical protein